MKKDEIKQYQMMNWGVIPGLPESFHVTRHSSMIGPRDSITHQEMLKILFFNFLNFSAKKLKKKGHLLVKLLFLPNSKYIISKLTSTSRKVYLISKSRKSRKSRV